MVNNYETVLILNPVLSEEQVRESMDKFTKLLSSLEGKDITSDLWGLKKMKYSIQNKRTGFYILFEFQGSSSIIADFEIELTRDERVMRFMTVKLDKHAIAFAEKRKKKITSK